MLSTKFWWISLAFLSFIHSTLPTRGSRKFMRARQAEERGIWGVRFESSAIAFYKTINPVFLNAAQTRPSPWATLLTQTLLSYLGKAFFYKDRRGKRLQPFTCLIRIGASWLLMSKWPDTCTCAHTVPVLWAWRSNHAWLLSWMRAR